MTALFFLAPPESDQAISRPHMGLLGDGPGKALAPAQVEFYKDSQDSTSMKTRGGNSAMLTTSDVADFLEVHSNTVRHWANRESIHVYRSAPRRGRSFKRENVDRFVRHNDFQSG